MAVPACDHRLWVQMGSCWKGLSLQAALCYFLSGVLNPLTMCSYQLRNFRWNVRPGFWASVFICPLSLGAGGKEMGGGSIDLKRSYVARVVNNPPTNAGDGRDVGSIPGSGRSPGEGKGNLLQYSCLENPMDRGVCGSLKESDTNEWLSVCPCTHAHTHIYFHDVHPPLWNNWLCSS